MNEVVTRLESLIRKLEAATGTPHMESPLKKLTEDKRDGEKKEKAPQQSEKKATQGEAGEEKKENKEKKDKAPQHAEKKDGQGVAGDEKKEKKPKKEAGGKAAPAQKLEPVIDDFVKCEFRIGDLQEVWKHPDSEKLYCEKINIGREVREIASGLQKFITIDAMKGKVVVFTNLKSKKLGGFPSHGMVMCASDKKVEGEEKIELVRPLDCAEIGERLFLEGQQELFPDVAVDACSSKVLERVCEKFKTDADGNIVYNGIKVCTKSGPLKAATLKNANVS